MATAFASPRKGEVGLRLPEPPAWPGRSSVASMLLGSRIARRRWLNGRGVPVVSVPGAFNILRLNYRIVESSQQEWIPGSLVTSGVDHFMLHWPKVVDCTLGPLFIRQHTVV